MRTHKSIKPFLKWAGGKRWFVANHDEIIHKNFTRYIEPFLGSGSVFFSLLPKNAVLSDINGDLIETYLAIKEQPDNVWRHLLAHKRNHSTNYYYHIRSSSPRTIATRAAKFIYLNRTCFNGLYRVNLKGEFNVPKGTKDTVVFPDDDFTAISDYLQHCELYTQDFEVTLHNADSGDFVYVDPPYTVRHNNNNFIKYNEKIFSWEDQERLSNAVTRAADRGAFVLISNADYPCIHKLYSSDHWVRVVVGRHSILASDVMNRRRTTELVISNYLNENGEQGAIPARSNSPALAAGELGRYASK